jgi:hypothetical protein
MEVVRQDRQRIRVVARDDCNVLPYFAEVHTAAKVNTVTPSYLHQPHGDVFPRALGTVGTKGIAPSLQLLNRSQQFSRMDGLRQYLEVVILRPCNLHEVVGRQMPRTAAPCTMGK